MVYTNLNNDKSSSWEKIWQCNQYYINTRRKTKVTIGKIKIAKEWGVYKKYIISKHAGSGLVPHLRSGGLDLVQEERIALIFLL